MKISIKSVIKTSNSYFECFDDQQIIFRVGNTLCIKELGKPDCQFISLSKHLDKLYSFRAMTSKKGAFTAERIGKEIQLAMYGLGGERKAILLPIENSFLGEIQKIQLLVDEYDNFLVYGSARGRDTSCVFLADFGKSKIMAIGYLPNFQDLKVEIRDNLVLSVCGFNGVQNYLKLLQYSSGQWEITEQAVKKIAAKIHQHQLLLGGRCLLVARTAIYILQDNELVKTIDLTEESSNIVEVIKLKKGILIRLDNDSLRLMVEDSDEISFMAAGTVRLQLQEGHQVAGLSLSNNGEEIWLNTSKNDLYVWRCDNIGLEISQSDLVFNKVVTSCSQEGEGSVSISSDKKYALLTGTNSIVLWGIEQGECILKSQFCDRVDPKKKTLFAGAVNPDGNSVILAFEDKIKIYKVLFTKFKFHAQFHIKRCQSLIYSHGGQLVACKYGKGINSCIVIINLLRLAELCIIKIQAQPSQIFWNQLDDQLIVTTENSQVQIYRVSEQARIHAIKVNDKIEHARFDYKTRKMLVSTENNILVVQNGSISQSLPAPVPDFHYIFPLYGIYFAATKSGILYWSSTLKFQTVHQLSLFSHKSFKLLCKSGYLLAYSSFADVIALKIVRSSEVNKKISDDIVFIEKQQVISLFDKVRDIQSRFEMLNSAYSIKLEDESQSYKKAVEQLQATYTKEIQFLNRKYQDLSSTKCRQEKESEEMFQKVEWGQLRNVDQIEKMYERKCQIERERYMNLQQANLEQKNKYEQVLRDLQAKYHCQIQRIREQYAAKIKMENSMMQKQKQMHLEDKKKVEMQLINLEEETEYTLNEIQMSKDAVIQQLRLSQKNLEEDNEKLQIQLDAQSYRVEELDLKAKQSKEELKRLQTRLQQAQNRNKLLEGDISRKDIMIEERDQIIKQQEHQIADLQKAKYVLSFRTTQIRKQLEPKEGLIDKLKSELMKLDDQYRTLKKKNYEIEQKLQKLQTINGISKRQSSDLKISLKYKERQHNELCSDIFMVINTVDPKDWNAEFVKIYQTYIKQDKHKDRQKKKKDDTSEEINRHLIHVEQSLLHVTTGNDRIMKGKDKEVFRKMKENSELVYELNVMRKKENQYQKQRKELINQNSKLKRQMEESTKTTTRTRTANTGHTRRFVASRELYSRDKTTIDVSDLSISKRDMREVKKDKSRLASARRTLMLQDDIKQKSGKFFDLAKELEAARSTIMRQDQMIEELNQRLLGMPNLQYHN